MQVIKITRAATRDTYRIEERRLRIEPREHLVYVKEEAEFGMERVVVLFVFEGRRAEIGGYNVQVDVSFFVHGSGT